MNFNHFQFTLSFTANTGNILLSFPTNIGRLIQFSHNIMVQYFKLGNCCYNILEFMEIYLHLLIKSFIYLRLILVVVVIRISDLR